MHLILVEPVHVQLVVLRFVAVNIFVEGLKVALVADVPHPHRPRATLVHSYYAHPEVARNVVRSRVDVNRVPSQVVSEEAVFELNQLLIHQFADRNVSCQLHITANFAWDGLKLCVVL